MEQSGPQTTHMLIDSAGLQGLLEALSGNGHRILGPTVRDEAIVYEDISSIGDLPVGWTDRQEPGRYAIERRDDGAYFGYAVGPHSWKRFLHPPTETVWAATMDEDGSVSFSVEAEPTDKLAFIGVRACEIRAIAIHDRVFREGPYTDTAYVRRRQDAFIVAVNCGQASGTCFCVSMDAGPGVDTGFDLALTELITDGDHRFLVEIGSQAGTEMMAAVPHEPATPKDLETAVAIIERTATQMGRSLDISGIKELLQENPEHPRWDDAAARCLSCGNCTMVCPTCFCTTVEDHGDVMNQTAERIRTWDSCFTMDFSFIHGGSVRSSTRSRYRQWLTHKLAHWIDQFDTSGCVGCGRCISWCPVGIDLTEEVAAIRESVDTQGKI